MVNVGVVCKLESVLGVLEDAVVVSLSKHFMATDVSATEQKSLRQVNFASLGTGTMVACLEQVDITDSVRERLKMSVKTLDSCSAYTLSACPGNPSGPAA